jgi:uncharacterized protein YjbJ (UPF0337 family)
VDSGTGDKIKGKIKKTTGKITGDRSQEIEGNLDEVKGDVKTTVNDLDKSSERKQKKRAA